MHPHCSAVQYSLYSTRSRHLLEPHDEVRVLGVGGSLAGQPHHAGHPCDAHHFLWKKYIRYTGLAIIHLGNLQAIHGYELRLGLSVHNIGNRTDSQFLLYQTSFNFLLSPVVPALDEVPETVRLPALLLLVSVHLTLLLLLFVPRMPQIDSISYVSRHFNLLSASTKS